MAIRLGPVSAAWSRPCPANGAGRAADQGLPRGELGNGRVVAVPRNNTAIVIRARDSNPHGPRPAAQQRGSGPRPVIVSISVIACRGLWPGRGHLRPRGARQFLGAHTMRLTTARPPAWHPINGSQADSALRMVSLSPYRPPAWMAWSADSKDRIRRRGWPMIATKPCRS